MADTWEVGVTYVIGHVRPDTDAIASALGYAWYLTAAGGASIRAARAGQPSAQAGFALDRFGIEPPDLLTSVAPTFGHAAQPQAPVAPDAPLSAAVFGLAAGARVVPVVDGDRKPIGVIGPVGMARALASAGAAGAPLDRPCREFIEAIPSFTAGERVRDHRPMLLRSDKDDFLVTDSAGAYRGIATRARILAPPRARLVMVDHNELSQAVAGAEEAELISVLDHHRLGNPPTAAPIPFIVEPVGSSSTLVAEACRERAALGEPRLPAPLAGMLLCGILSDTLVFRSPTCTQRDRAAAEWLARLAEVDAQQLGDELLHAAPGLLGRPAAEILDGDRKAYRMGRFSASVAQVEVTDLNELPECREAILAALEERVGREKLDLACLLVTDVVAGRSRLLCRGQSRLLAALPFTRDEQDEWNVGSMVSRKKQLVPALTDVLEQFD